MTRYVDLAINARANASARVVSLVVYACSSDHGGMRAFATTSAVAGGTVDSVTTGYAAWEETVGGAGDGYGKFRVDRPIRPEDVRDGLGNTIAVGESASLVVNAWAGALGNGCGSDQVLARTSAKGLDPTISSPAAFIGPQAWTTHIAMADGSAHGSRADLVADVCRALATRAGREALDQEAF